LTNAAKQFGYEFRERDADGTIVIYNKHINEEMRYELLNVCEFNSTRKRMSVIVKD